MLCVTKSNQRLYCPVFLEVNIHIDSWIYKIVIYHVCIYLFVFTVVNYNLWMECYFLVQRKVFWWVHRFLLFDETKQEFVVELVLSTPDRYLRWSIQVLCQMLQQPQYPFRQKQKFFTLTVSIIEKKKTEMKSKKESKCVVPRINDERVTIWMSLFIVKTKLCCSCDVDLHTSQSVVTNIIFLLFLDQLSHIFLVLFEKEEKQYLLMLRRVWYLILNGSCS